MTDTGVWIAAYSDLSGITVHASEIDALRAVNGTSKVAHFVKWGADVVDVVRG